VIPRVIAVQIVGEEDDMALAFALAWIDESSVNHATGEVMGNL
jgi:hypothetical protein